MQEKNICPGCGRHCDLERPHCGRGEEYRRAGNMPERQGKHRDQKMQTVDDPAADINDGLILSLRDLHHTMRSLYEGKASQKRILIILNGLEAITQRDLTERLGIQPGSASEILSKLEGSGWIVRTQNESDRRTTDISLTDSGRKVAEEALKQRRQRHEEMFSCLSGEEKQELLSLLDKVRCDWKNDTRKTRIRSDTAIGMDAGMRAATMKDMAAGMRAATMKDMAIGMKADTMGAQMGMEDADHVEIHQKVSALCHHRRPVHARRGDDGPGAAGIHEPDRG